MFPRLKDVHFDFEANSEPVRSPDLELRCNGRLARAAMSTTQEREKFLATYLTRYGVLNELHYKRCGVGA